MIRERMEVEHYWGESFSGEHIPGGTTVMDKGDSTAMSAVSNPADGSLFLLQDGSGLQINIYDGGWAPISTLDHLELSGTADNDHPNLLLKSGGALSGDLDMGGYKISTNGSGSTFGNFLLYGHKDLPHLATIDNVAALNNACIGQDEIKVTQTEVTQTIASGSSYHISLVGLFYFLPQIYAKTAFNSDIYIAPSGSADYGIDIVNKSGAPVDFRIRTERIVY